MKAVLIPSPATTPFKLYPNSASTITPPMKYVVATNILYMKLIIGALLSLFPIFLSI